MAYFQDGSVLATDQIGDFISDAEWSHFSSALVEFTSPLSGALISFVLYLCEYDLFHP